tara:strand:- start:2037 stop:2459 length:423 start_codon:yes stop_codon:yes gene_type:complete
MKVSAAGIIIFRNENNHPVILGLKALPKFRRRSNGTYDIPKGRIDPGETAFQAAERECFEESGLLPERIVAGPFIDGPMVVWLGQTDEDVVVISENPETGEKEHEGYAWLKPEQIKKDCLDYLKTSLTWAENEIWKYFKL